MIALRAQQLALMRQIVAPEGDAAPAAGVDGRIDVYRGAYRARLVAALRDNYGTLPTVMGDEAFEALAQAYIDARPARHASIRWFGDGLSAFMAAQEDLVAHPAMVELAQLEWALRGAFDAAHAEPLDGAALARVPVSAWADLVFTPLPSVRWVALRWQIEPVWQALKGLDGAAAPPLDPPQPFEHAVVVWRPRLEVRWRSVAPARAQLLDAALRGAPFAELCVQAAAQVGEPGAAAHAAQALADWVRDGLFSAWHERGASSLELGPAGWR
jgi:hypothetical protein